jgi:O-antigen ligase
MARVAEIALITAVAAAVLMFGGTEPVSFTVVEVILLGAAFFLVLAHRTGAVPSWRPAFVIPPVLVGVVALQLCPLPGKLAQRVADGTDHTIVVHSASLSFAPYSTRTHLLILVVCLSAYYLAQIVCQDRDRKQRLIGFLVALGTFEAFFGLVQYLSGWQKIFTYTKKYDLEEATGTYVNRNHYAGFLEMVLPFAVVLAVYQYGKMRRNQHRPTSKMKNITMGAGFQSLLFWIFISAVIFIAIVFSRSRMGILSSLTCLTVMLCLLRLKQRTGLALSAIFTLLTICFLMWIGIASPIGRFHDVGREFNQNSGSRISIWRDTLPLIRNHPFIGTGLGSFPVAFTTGQKTFLNQFVNHAHNDYLEIASDLGLPAAAMFFISVLFILARTVRTFLSGEGKVVRFTALGCAASIIAILMHSLTDFNLYIPANALVFSVVLGIAVSARPTLASAIAPGS